MAQFSSNRFPMETWNKNIQWSNSPVNLLGNSNSVPPFQIPPTPALRLPQHEGFPQYSGLNGPPFSNVPLQVRPPEFNIMLPPNNQTFPVNINAPQNFPNTSENHNFARTPDQQNIPRMVGPPNSQGAHYSQNFHGAPGFQNYSGAPVSQNLPGVSGVQNFPSTANTNSTFSGAPNPPHFPGAPSHQNFSGAPSPQTFHGAPGSQPLPRAPASQTFSGPPGPQNFQRPFYPQNFQRASNPQNFPRVSEPQNFPRAPDPQNFPRMPDPQNFQRMPDPQNFQRPPNHQNFSRPPNPQNFPRPPDPQNFSQPPNPQNFPRPPDPQNFPQSPDHQNFQRTPDPQNFPRNPNSPNFPRGPNFQNFPANPNAPNFRRVPNQQNFQGGSNLHNFSRSSDSQNFPGAHNPPPSGPNAQNFHGESTYEKYPPMSGASPRPFTPWKQFSSEGQRTQFQTRSWESNPSRQFRDYSSQENKRGTPKIRNFKKLKEDNREKPFSCDTCDRAFVTETDLQDHISQHITCNHANCTFEAHPKIVALHKKMQHDTGYAERINRLKDAEEIKKWREERRKRFPTAENIRKRQAEQAEREARGEVLETKEFGKFKRRREDNEMNSKDRRRRGKRFKRRNDRFRNFTPRTQTFPINVDSETDSDSDSHIKLNRFPGMLSLTNSVDEAINNNEGKDSTCPLVDDDNPELQNLSEQNLPKSQSEDYWSQSAVPCADSNSNNQVEDKTIQLDHDKLDDATSSSMIKVSDDKSMKEKNNATIEDSDDEAPVAEPIVKCIEKSILTNGDLNENKDDVNESVCEIPNDKSETEQIKNVEVVQVADSDDEAPTVAPIQKSLENSLSVDSRSDQNKDHENMTESSEAQTKVTENGYNRNNNRYNRYPRNQHNQMNGQDFVQVPRKSSLLEKLLADDIRHERNVILQCIRHIVKNNFFGIENNTHK